MEVALELNSGNVIREEVFSYNIVKHLRKYPYFNWIARK